MTPSIGTKKFQKKFEKTLDKLKKMCYNKYVIKRDMGEQVAILVVPKAKLNEGFDSPHAYQKNFKKVKKTLDKSKKVWYNKYVIKGTKTL